HEGHPVDAHQPEHHRDEEGQGGPAEREDDRDGQTLLQVRQGPPEGLEVLDHSASGSSPSQSCSVVRSPLGRSASVKPYSPMTSSYFSSDSVIFASSSLYASRRSESLSRNTVAPAPTCSLPSTTATNGSVTSTLASSFLSAMVRSEMPVRAKASARPRVTASMPSCELSTSRFSMSSCFA